MSAVGLIMVALAIHMTTVAPPEPPARFEGRVVKVHDGDTVDVAWKGHNVRVRLDGIDAPEKGQPFSRKATKLVRELTSLGPVSVVGPANDRYDRRIGRVFLADGRSLNMQLVARGLAWHYVRYSDDAALAALEAKARAARRGLWVDPKPTPPWEFRQAKRPQPKSTPVPEGKVVGNTRSRIYHAPGCPDREKVSPRNRELFDSVAEAVAAGYRAARNCRRD